MTKPTIKDYLLSAATALAAMSPCIALFVYAVTH
jgi:hypothetical protein